jgi:hypothetical protein
VGSKPEERAYSAKDGAATGEDDLGFETLNDGGDDTAEDDRWRFGDLGPAGGCSFGHSRGRRSPAET